MLPVTSVNKAVFMLGFLELFPVKTNISMLISIKMIVHFRA